MLLKAFINASSFPVVILPLMAIFLCISSPRPTRFPFELFVLAFLLIYGIIGVINALATYRYDDNVSYIVGIITGICMAIADTMTIEVRRRCFDLMQTDAWQFYFIAIFFHTLIVRFIMTPLNYITYGT